MLQGKARLARAGEGFEKRDMVGALRSSSSLDMKRVIVVRNWWRAIDVVRGIRMAN